MFCSFHPLADKTNNKHLLKPFFKVIRKSLYRYKTTCLVSFAIHCKRAWRWCLINIALLIVRNLSNVLFPRNR